MQTMPIITKTAKAWGVLPHLPKVLRAPYQERKAGKDSSRSDVCCDCSGEKCSKQGSNHCGIEISTTSFFNRGWE